ncbi:uncharacterized protein LOC133330221 [Musca vetustissima]|uniref:uncharacterized protein LOC133330221 n=1 Tax=Musca vetustissima TaxID=27455 RepID=UPI002AB71ACB|nr:uncharacterized protein LOC133330221 [Musca vetustissima]
MRSFIILCIVGWASAGRLGYNYEPSVSISGVPFGGYSSPSYSSPSYNTPSFPAPPAVELNKEFYTFSAPENDFNDLHLAEQVASTLKQSVRVIFIKGPENHSLENAALALAKQAAQQQTAIYVLNKQPDLNELAHKLNSLGTNHNFRPEVHFVKYRTPEDAVNAQHAIQSQYDLLGGSSQNFNGGVAPVINFASEAPVATSGTVKFPDNTYLPSSIFHKR